LFHLEKPVFTGFLFLIIASYRLKRTATNNRDAKTARLHRI